MLKAYWAGYDIGESAVLVGAENASFARALAAGTDPCDCDFTDIQVRRAAEADKFVTGRGVLSLEPLQWREAGGNFGGTTTCDTCGLAEIRDYPATHVCGECNQCGECDHESDCNQND